MVIGPGRLCVRGWRVLRRMSIVGEDVVRGFKTDLLQDTRFVRMGVEHGVPLS